MLYALRRVAVTAAVLVSVLLSVRTASAQIDARMLRYPAVSKTQIAFVYAGDVWLVSKQGGKSGDWQRPDDPLRHTALRRT